MIPPATAVHYRNGGLHETSWLCGVHVSARYGGTWCEECAPEISEWEKKGCGYAPNLTSSLAECKMDRSIADGTLPLIAVIVTLGVLLLVAAMATCYRYWDYRRHQPRIPFWSIELQDEKTDLHSHCQYQHLDAATSKTVSATQAPVHQSNGEVGRLNSDSLRRTYNTINV
ncbi:laminin EGF-like domain-containing protein [Nephila pilipes]|uniref:Laminin EGF-like domain-containing protein n=1 Tax=Nephila pilipes TaxID=299642 RepID=A0A8X6QBQ0_NEPPI|nr:laminin EGF-like domain-containing protein [Nephila pilipes]